MSGQQTPAATQQGAQQPQQQAAQQPQQQAAQQAQQPQQAAQQPQPQPPQPRARRTHTTEAIIKALKALPLKFKLQKNKEIEHENDDRAFRDLQHATDPATYPNPASERASMVTIDSADTKALFSVPSFADTFKAVMPPSLLRLIGEHDVRQKAEKEKRKFDDLSSTHDMRVAKRRCMTGLNLVARNVEAPTEFKFPQILFDTEEFYAVPLSFFTHKNLRYIIDRGSMLPTRRANGVAGDKGPMILDIEKLEPTLGGELSLDYGLFFQAAEQFYNFQSERDPNGVGGSWSNTVRKHFAFFQNQSDAEEYYASWKHPELRLRQERRTFNYAYDPTYYDSQYQQAKNNQIQNEAMKAELERRDAKLKFELKAAFTNSGSSNIRLSSRDSRSFLPGSGGSSAASYCLLCAEKGHQAHQHPADKHQFSDGKKLYAKIGADKKIVSPDNKEICISFNLRGKSGCTGFANHRNGPERIHACSYCGSFGHHAFAWICRTKPA